MRRTSSTEAPAGPYVRFRPIDRDPASALDAGAARGQGLTYRGFPADRRAQQGAHPDPETDG